MKTCYAYNPNRFRTLDKDDVQRWLSLFSIISFNITFIDRTTVIKVPIKTEIAPQLQMPKYDPTFSVTYEECCQRRAQEILKKQEELDVPIKVLYSGGIDSSLVLSSFIKELGLTEAEKRIQIIMNTDSIEENPWMWHNVIRKSNFKLNSSELFVNEWDNSRILVGGEFNDQLLGSDVYKDLVRWRGNGFLHQPITQDIMTEYHLTKGLSTDLSEMWADLFMQSMQQAPCKVETVADWWWWINFSCKWPSVYFRSLASSKLSSLSQSYLDNYYFQFFGSDDFQRWSMVDRTHKHRGDFLSYKWHARDLVADFLNEQQYRYKVKRGSLGKVLFHRAKTDVIDTSYNFIHNIDPCDWYNPDNSFQR